MRLTVTDFQSLGHVAVEVSGLTVLVGPSNRGKSALIRALEAVLFNKPGDEFVRHGKKKATVEIVNAPTTDGTALLDVKWTKGGGKTVYDLSGDLYTKVGQGTPPLITEAGYRDVWIGDKDRKKGEWLRPQVSEQGPGTYFLLNRSGAFVSDVLGAISRHAVLLTAQGRAAGDQRGTKQALGYKQTDLGKAHEQLDALEGVPAFAARVSLLAQAQARADALRVKVARLRSLLEWQTVYRAFLKVELPAATLVPPNTDRWVFILSRGTELAAARPSRLALGGSEVPVVVEVPELPNIAKARGLTGRRAVLAPLAACTLPASVDVHLPSAGVWADGMHKLEAIVDRRLKAIDMLYRCQTAVKSTKVEAEAASADLKLLLDGLKVCPTCEQPLVTGVRGWK
jgi:hypothetical protein